MVRLGGHIPSRAWIGMVISFIGVLIITGIDFQISTRAFIGDVCAIACAALAALYMTLGAHAQRTLNTSTYTTICYFVCSIDALIFALIKGDKIVGFEAREWLLLLALTFGAQILGHTLFNLTLKRLSPAIVSLVIFFEVPVSAILAYWWIGQVPPQGTIPGVLVLLFGCVIFVLRNRETESSTKAQ
jgi:drug/metabolite transporter (DMT)-like permease